MARLAGRESRRLKPLLLYVASSRDPQRFAVGPTLAAAAERAGWAFDCYYDARRLGLHFGGGDADAEMAAGSTVAGGRHVEQLLWLSTVYDIAAAGYAASPLWPTLKAIGAECLAATAAPLDIFGAVFRRLDEPIPDRLLLVDAAPQGAHRVVTAPYLFPSLLTGPPAIAVEVSAGHDTIAEATAASGSRATALWLAPRPMEQLGELIAASAGDVADRTYAEVTAAMARHHEGWGKGVLLADPSLVAAQLPKAARLRLVPLYGRPQVDVVRAAADLIAAANEPVYGRQHDDRDFVEIARLGHGLQVLDPAPPFDAAATTAPAIRTDGFAVRDGDEPSDAQLAAWAEKGTVVTTLVFWAGMVRELDCLPLLCDVVAMTGLRAGVVVTVDTLLHGLRPPLALLGEATESGGVAGQLELLAGSTGWGVAAEAYMPIERLATLLCAAREKMAALLPGPLVPRGWWPLLDTTLVAAGQAMPVGWQGRPVVYFTPREMRQATDAQHPESAGGPPPRLAGRVVDALGLRRFAEARRPFDRMRPGRIDPDVVRAARRAGFDYMWTKAGFGRPQVVAAQDGMVALPFTAGNWDGWSPFYTVASCRDFERAEQRLLRRRRPGWLVSTVDSPLWLLPGEAARRGCWVHEVAALAARGGASRALVNVTPNVVARYARLLASRPGERQWG